MKRNLVIACIHILNITTEYIVDFVGIIADSESVFSNEFYISANTISQYQKINILRYVTGTFAYAM